MSIVPKGCIELSYQRVVRVRGEENMIPLALLKDEQERTMAVPLDPLEETLIQHALNGNSKGPKPYHTLVLCLRELGVNVNAVHILYNDELDLHTRLILSKKSGGKVEVDIPCVEGITCAQLSKAPLYIAEELMASISASAPKTETNC